MLTGGKKVDVPVPKQTFGRTAGHQVKLNPQSRFKDICFYTEGPETALGILQALPQAQVNVLLGSSGYKHLPEIVDKTVSHHVLCLDNDVGNKVTKNAALVAAESLSASGKTAWLIMPPLPDKSVDKWDFNDVLKVQGVGAVLDIIKQASIDIREPSHDKLQGKLVLYQAYVQFEKLQALKPDKILALNPSLNKLYKITGKEDLGR